MSRTLADMTPEEREQCVGMWAEWKHGEGREKLAVIEVMNTVRDFAGLTIPGVRFLEVPRHRLGDVTPRFDMLRAWNPDGTPAATTEEVEYRIVNPDTNGGRYEMRRWSRHVTEWKPQ